MADQEFWTQTIDIIKENVQQAKTPGSFSSRSSSSNIFIPKPDPSPSVTSIIIPEATGMYRLDCYLRFWDYDDFGVKFIKNIQPIGKHDNVSASRATQSNACLKL